MYTFIRKAKNIKKTPRSIIIKKLISKSKSFNQAVTETTSKKKIEFMITVKASVIIKKK